METDETDRKGAGGRRAPRRSHDVRVGGSVVTLDRPVIIGRKPSGPRVGGPVAPRLVTVDSPRGEVSASHVEVRQEGNAVVVSDLRSTNGTRVMIPGRQPVALRQGESIVVLVGTIVDIGDGNHLEILPLKRLTPEEETHP